MVVTYEGRKWELDMCYQLFESLKKQNPRMKVEVLETCGSSYKRMVVVPIGELKDYSVERNLHALGK